MGALRSASAELGGSSSRDSSVFTCVRVRAGRPTGCSLPRHCRSRDLGLADLLPAKNGANIELRNRNASGLLVVDERRLLRALEPETPRAPGAGSDTCSKTPGSE